MSEKTRPAVLLWTMLGAFAMPLAAAVDSRTITFREAVRIALERNVTVRQAENAAVVSEIAVSDARMQFVPDLFVDTSTTQSYGRNFNDIEGRIVNETSRSARFGLSSGV